MDHLREPKGRIGYAGKDPMGILATIIPGIVGSIIGGHDPAAMDLAND